MKEVMTPQLATILKEDLGIDPEYRHAPKRVISAETFESPDAVLKWYAVHWDDRPVPRQISELARSYLTKIELEARGLGFVILHRCEDDFYFLIVCTWRNNNELWETVFYKSGGVMADFALFPRDATAKGTFCVWELAAVWHEKEAWERFLKSPRDESAARAWLRDRHAGAA